MNQANQHLHSVAQPNIAALNAAIVYPVPQAERELREAREALAIAESRARRFHDEERSPKVSPAQTFGPRGGYTMPRPEQDLLRDAKEALTLAEERHAASVAAAESVKKSPTSWLTAVAHLWAEGERFAPGQPVPAYRLALSGMNTHDRVLELVGQGYLFISRKHKPEIEPPAYRALCSFALPGRGVLSPGDRLSVSDVPRDHVAGLLASGRICELTPSGPEAA